MFEKIAKILEGIDRTEYEDGWWETSVGAKFGAEILERIRKLLEGERDEL